MLTKNFTRTVRANVINRTAAQSRVFSVGVTNLPDILKTTYTEEFDQGLTEEEKKSMKRIDIYRTNPNE